MTSEAVSLDLYGCRSLNVAIRDSLECANELAVGEEIPLKGSELTRFCTGLSGHRVCCKSNCPEDVKAHKPRLAVTEEVGQVPSWQTATGLRVCMAECAGQAHRAE